MSQCIMTVIFSTIVHVSNGGVGGCSSGDKKGFHIEIIISLPSGKVLLTAPLKNHGIFEMMKSQTLMALYSHCWPPFGPSRGM